MEVIHSEVGQLDTCDRDNMVTLSCCWVVDQIGSIHNDLSCLQILFSKY